LIKVDANSPGVGEAGVWAEELGRNNHEKGGSRAKGKKGNRRVKNREK